MHLVETFVRNPVKVSVAVILLTLFGTIALFRMPIQLIPEVNIPTLTIQTRWPGASPQEIEREIVQEQEEQLQSVEGVRKMSSESSDSFGQITLEFPVGTDMSEALLKVNTRLQQVREYPADADEPVITTSNASDRPIAWLILGPRTPTDDDIVAFQQKHPRHHDALELVRKAQNPGLGIYRLRKLALEHPEVKPLLPADVDVTLLRKFAEDFLESRFERVKGVSNANVFGGREEELQVIVDPERLAARQLTINDVRMALRGQNKDTSGGDFWEGKRRYVVRSLGQFRSPEQVANAIISRREGVPVYVKDVAEVQLGHKKPDGFVRRFGTSVIAINVQRETGSNILDVMEGIREANRELNAGALKQRGLELVQVYDETEYIHSSINLVRDNLVEGAVLTFIVLVLFLRSLRSTVVVFLSILVSFIGMFLVMNLLGRSLNVPSLAGIAFAVGMLVDNFIVVLENIYRHRQQGAGTLTAVVRGTKEVWGAVMASTLTNLAVFVPVLFVQEEAGQLFRDIALATASALALSLLVALVLVPTAAGNFLRRGMSGGDPETNGELGSNGELIVRPVKPQGKVRRAFTSIVAFARRWTLGPLDAFGRGFVNLVVAVNAWLLQGVLRRVVVAVVFVAASLYFSYLLLPKVEYLPPGNRNLIFAIIAPPAGYNLNTLREIGEEVERRLQPYWNIDPESDEAKKLDYPPIGDFFFVARGRMVFMGVRAVDPLKAGKLVDLLNTMKTSIPGAFFSAKQSSLFEQGLSAGRTVDIEIVGPDVRKLVALGGQIFGQVTGKDSPVPGSGAFPRPSLDLANPEVHVTPKWEQAADLGVSAVDLGYAVDALVDGAYATDYFTGGDKIDLTIIGKEQFAKRSQDLEALPISTPTGQLVPLAAVAHVRLASGPEQINRRERQRAITIEVSPPKEMPVEEAMDRIKEHIIAPLVERGELGEEYQINLSGTADKLHSTWVALRWNLLLAVVISYLLMAALFESWLYPFVIMLSVPLGAVGGLFGLWLLNHLGPVFEENFVWQQLDVLTMLGFIILVGTVVNNPILIVEQALVHIREDRMPVPQAVLESVRTRIRPIFMTALIGLFGLLPLVISPGAGSELYRGIGAVLLGGLVFSTVFTLVFVPCVLTLTMGASERLRQALGRKPLEPAAVQKPKVAEPAGVA